MYKWPKNINISDLENANIELISFTSNTTIIHFDNNISITIIGNMDYHLSNKSTESITFPIKYTSLVSIIGKCIISASIKTDGCSILIEFENDSSIDIDGSDIEFECYSANWKGIEFVV